MPPVAMRRRWRRAVATTQQEMDAQAQADTAMQAATDQQAAVAALRRITEEATLMHLAALLLDASLTQVEMASQSGMLARIAELFSTITAGTYPRLEVDDPGDGSAGLMAVHRGFPDERKAVADLSEGERDQLFLALRLAAIEDHVATAPPLPFVCDDILQTFDDDRALAAMQALVQLSEKVQVILLSHHRHLAVLSERMGPERIHLCYSNLSRAARGREPAPGRLTRGSKTRSVEGEGDREARSLLKRSSVPPDRPHPRALRALGQRHLPLPRERFLPPPFGHAYTPPAPTGGNPMGAHRQ